jgi:hypothetical protein
MLLLRRQQCEKFIILLGESVHARGRAKFALLLLVVKVMGCKNLNKTVLCKVSHFALGILHGYRYWIKLHDLARTYVASITVKVATTRSCHDVASNGHAEPPGMYDASYAKPTASLRHIEK